MAKLVCKFCLEQNGVTSAAVVEHLCISPTRGKQFTAYVCERCLGAGRETRVTCRTFAAISVSAAGEWPKSNIA